MYRIRTCVCIIRIVLSTSERAQQPVLFPSRFVRFSCPRVDRRGHPTRAKVDRGGHGRGRSEIGDGTIWGGMLSRREDMLMKRLTVLLEVFPSGTSLRSAAAVREQLLAQHSTAQQGNWHNRGCYRTQTYGRELRLRAGDSCTPRWLQSTSSPVLRTASR